MINTTESLNNLFNLANLAKRPEEDAYDIHNIIFALLLHGTLWHDFPVTMGISTKDAKGSVRGEAKYDFVTLTITDDALTSGLYLPALLLETSCGLACYKRVMSASSSNLRRPFPTWDGRTEVVRFSQALGNTDRKDGDLWKRLGELLPDTGIAKDVYVNAVEECLAVYDTYRRNEPFAPRLVQLIYTQL